MEKVRKNARRAADLYALAKSQFDRDDAPDRDDMRAVASLPGVGA
jgi:hypothetical protein